MTAKVKTKLEPAKADVARPPIIVVMGHIDHGKSTLLDYIRQTKIVESEIGGITQSISAYEVNCRREDGRVAKITFIDTPGHEAFGDMRTRGASLADIAILIISAEEGVKPQTVEALKAIQTQKLPYVVAINKIDRPNANADLVKQQLAEKEALVEGYGGTIPWVAISAKTGAGIDELLELLLLTADLVELKSHPEIPATGLILEANLNPKSGNAAVLIIKDGHLRLGDYLVIENTACKIKALRDFRGQAAKELGPSSPAIVIGLNILPPVGATFKVYPDRQRAEQAAANHQITKPAIKTGAPNRVDNDSQDIASIPLVIKADVTGSLAAIAHELKKLETATVKLKIIELETGPITEADVQLGTTAKNSLVLGFNVKATKAALELAEREQVRIETFDIIYKLSEWLAEEIKRRTPLHQVEVTIGKAKILKLFSGTKNKQVLGGAVLDGKLVDGKSIKIMRRDSEIGSGRIGELQQQKMRVKEVETGNQFGALVEAKIAIAVGDTLVVYDIVNQ